MSACGELTERAGHAEPADFFTTYNAKQAEIAARIVAKANETPLPEARRCLLEIIGAVRRTSDLTYDAGDAAPLSAARRRMMPVLDGLDALADHHSREAHKAFQSGDVQHGTEQQLGAEWLRDRAHELFGDCFADPEPDGSLGDAALSALSPSVAQATATAYSADHGLQRRAS